MNTKPSCALSFVIARNSMRTVILRRGPSGWVRCILWDRADDSFQDGQWLKGTVRAEDCDLSPDGRHFIYVSAKHNTPTGWFTAISRPPFFTALVIYPTQAPFGLGGRFVDNTRYTINYPFEDRDRIAAGYRDLRLVFEAKPTKTNPLGFVDAKGRRVNLRPDDVALHGREVQSENPLAGYLTDGGKLYRVGSPAPDPHAATGPPERLGGAQAAPGGGAPASQTQPQLIRDFTDMRFEEVIAPYDDRDPTAPAAWHPLDAEAGR